MRSPAAMKGHAADESLSEETRESAQKALDALVLSQAEVIKLESEQDAALKKLELEAQFERDDLSLRRIHLAALAVCLIARLAPQMKGTVRGVLLEAICELAETGCGTAMLS